MELIEKQIAIDTVGLNTWAGSRISKLPTVEAIPIEWIKEYENKIFKKPERKSFDWQVIDVIDKLLKDWEKENEDA